MPQSLYPQRNEIEPNFHKKEEGETQVPTKVRHRWDALQFILQNLEKVQELKAPGRV